MMMTMGKEVSGSALMKVRRARTTTLAKWWADINCYRYASIPEELGWPGDGNRAHQLMDVIACELGMRYLRELRKRR